MGRQLKPLDFSGQGNDNAGGRKLIADIVLHNHLRTLTGLNMTVGKHGNINDNNIATLIRFHNYLLYLVTLLTINSTSDCGSGGLQAWELAYNSSL